MIWSTPVRLAALSLALLASAACGGGDKPTSCTYSLSEAAASLGAAGGTVTFDVAAGSTCAWTAAAGTTWVAVTDGGTGTGAGTVTVTVEPNPSGLARSGAVTAGGKDFTVTQAGAACTFTILPTEGSFGAAGGVATLDVATPLDCAWTATSGASWLQVTGGSPGSGPGTLAVAVQANATTTSRTAAITVGDGTSTATYTAVQGGAGCTYALSSPSATALAAGGSGTVGVTAGAGCAWLAASSEPWLTLAAGGAGSGTGTVAWDAAPNPATASRSATLTVGGQIFTVTQDGASCADVAISPAGESFGAAGGTGSLTVTLPSGCAWTATASAAWITVTAGGAGTASGTATFSVAANLDPASRTGTIEVLGQSFAITQGGAACTYALAAATGTATATGGAGSVGVTSPAGCFWSATSDAAWLTITAGTGSGTGTVRFDVAANPSSVARSATVTVAGQPFRLDQGGASCATVTLSPPNHSLGPTAGSGSVAVGIAGGCLWTASTGDAWLTVTGGGTGSGPGTVFYAVAENAATTSRTGSLSIAGRTFDVSQGGASCSWSLSPASAAPAAAGGSGSVTVSAGTGCTWFATSSAPWLTVTAGAAGSGNGTVGWAAAANPSSSPRTATLDVAGQPFTVTQAGASCSASSISPASASYAAAAASGSVALTIPAGCSWTASSDATAWLTITSGASGAGSGSVAYAVTANGAAASRTGTLTVAGHAFAVAQGGTACTWNLAASSTSVPATLGSGTASVTSPAGCAWTASSEVPWITLTSGATGSGNGTVSFQTTANPGPSPRAGTITVAGLPFTVNQAGAPCTYVTSPTPAELTGSTFSAAAGAGVVSVTAPTGCAWTATATSVGSWLTVTGSASGSGSGTVFYRLSENGGNANRTGLLTIGGVDLTIVQGWGAGVGIVIE
jgi:hypothetical protein